jgi:radical SAM superfamily enzyme YgiQ (UPF0313 family)
VIDDARHGRMEKFYRQETRPSLAGLEPDRRIFRGKRYLRIGLVEAGRGCHLNCDFCAVQVAFNQSQVRRPLDDVLAEIRAIRNRSRLIFLVDDNIASNMDQAKELFAALIPLKVRWVSQASINAAHDEEFLDLLKRSGCQAVLIGFESLDDDNLRSMNKGFNLMGGGFERALENLHRSRIGVYGTFIFGYDHDTPETCRRAVEFAKIQGLFIAAFAHLMPFPGTPLYERLRQQGRLHYDAWWLDDEYRYNDVPFQPRGMSPPELQRFCLEARRSFYTWSSILRRSRHRLNRANAFMFRNFFLVNAMHRAEVSGRDGYPLGDKGWQGQLIKA